MGATMRPQSSAGSAARFCRQSATPPRRRVVLLGKSGANNGGNALTAWQRRVALSFQGFPNGEPRPHDCQAAAKGIRALCGPASLRDRPIGFTEKPPKVVSGGFVAIAMVFNTS